MIYVPIRFLHSGMVLAKDAPGSSFFLPLLASGQALTDSVIRRLHANGIAGVYIESALSTEEPDELIEPKKKKQILTDIKKIYTTCSAPNANLSAIYKPVANLAQDLVASALTKDTILINVVDIRDYDNYTYSHSMYVALLSTLLGMELKLPKLALNDLATAGLMHDIGKIDLPIDIINKPGRLTDDEFEKIKQHPQNSRKRLDANGAFTLATMLGVESHHEKYDGSGYPHGLAGEEIPLHGRILALADVYDALTSNRPYREAWDPGDVINYMMSCANTHFDCNLLQTFVSILSAYPVGTVVLLSNGWMGVVSKNSKGYATRPVVCVASPAEERGRLVDLANDPDFLSVTIQSTLTSCDMLPEGLQL